MAKTAKTRRGKKVASTAKSAAKTSTKTSASARTLTGSTRKQVAKKTKKAKKVAKNTNKTQKTSASVHDFLASIPDPAQRQDSHTLLKLMQELTGERPFMYGTSIVGFGAFSMTYDSGREVDWFLTGFSPRKQNLTIYIMSGFARYPELMSRLGKHKTGKSCLYVKSLADIDQPTLATLIRESVDHLKREYAS